MIWHLPKPGSAGIPGVSGRNGDFCNPCGGLGHRVAVGTESFDVKLDAFAHELLGFLQRGAGDAETGKVGSVSAPACLGFFQDDRVSLHFRPACLRILLYVPLAISTEGWP